jgi:hypothetical protein
MCTMELMEKGTHSLLYILLNQLKNLWKEEIKLTTIGKRKENKVFYTWANFCTVSQVPHKCDVILIEATSLPQRKIKELL